MALHFMGVCERQYHIVAEKTNYGVRLIGSNSGLCDMKLILCVWAMYTV